MRTLLLRNTMDLNNLLSFITQNENVLGYSILFISSVIEYVFPPFPGDTVTLFGAFLVAARGWSFYWVFLSATLGSVVGSSIDYMLGYRIKKWREGKIDSENHISQKGSRLLTKERFDFIKEKIDRYGTVYIILNRFMPGIRAFFFVAAGFAEMNFLSVMFYNLISVTLWNLGIIYVGILIGTNWARLLAIFKTYSEIVTFVIIIAVTFLMVRFLFFKKTKKSPPRYFF